MTALVAGDKTSEGKILVQVRTSRPARLAGQPLLDAFIGRKADQSFVLSLAQRHVPRGQFEITRVKRLNEEVVDALTRDRVIARLRELRVSHQEACHFRFRFQKSRCEPFQSLADYRGQRLLPDEHLAAAGRSREAVAERRSENPIAVERASTHTVERLLAVLLPLMLRNTRQQILDKPAIGVVAKFD